MIFINFIYGALLDWFKIDFSVHILQHQIIESIKYWNSFFLSISKKYFILFSSLLNLRYSLQKKISSYKYNNKIYLRRNY